MLVCARVVLSCLFSSSSRSSSHRFFSITHPNWCFALLIGFALSVQANATPSLSSFSCAAATMAGSGTDLCTVVISAPATTPGFRVALASNNAAIVIGPASLVPTGATSQQFKVTVNPVSTSQVVTLTASDGQVSRTFAIQLNPPAAALSFSVSSVAFGTVPVGTTATRSVTVTSSGTAPLVLSNLSVSGTNFAATSGLPITLNPGQSTVLTVSFAPTAEAATTGQLTLANNSTNGNAVLALNGSGGPLLTGFSCANASMSGSGTDLCTVTLNVPAIAPGFRVALASSNPAIVVGPASLVPAGATSQQFKVTVNPVSTAQSVTLTATDGQATKAFVIQIMPPFPSMSLNTTAVDFGTVPLSIAATKSVTVTSNGTAPLVLNQATLTGTGFGITTALPITLNPGQSTVISLAFAPASEGVTSGQLVLASNSTGGAATVGLTGNGGPLLTSFSCSSASVTGAVTILCTTGINAPALAPGFRVGLSTNAVAVSVGPASLVHTGMTAQQFTVNIAPVTSSQIAVLTASDGFASIAFSIQLNTAFPVLSPETTLVDFGNVALQVPVTRIVRLDSTGTLPLVITNVGITGSGFSLASAPLPMTLNPGQSSTLSVVFDPQVEGASIGQVTIASNASPANLVIPVTGAGATAGTFSYAGSPIATTYAPPNPGTPIAPSYFGMTIQHTSTPFPDFPVSTLRYWDVAPWASIETSRNTYDWSHLDAELATGQQNGVVDSLYTFGDTPPWASTDPTAPCSGGDGVGTCAPPDRAAFDNFVTTLVQRYCGKIQYYETWNEANNAPYWNGTQAQLLTLASDVNQIVKDPANCGCTDGVCSPGGGVNPNQVLLPSINKVNATSLAWLDSYLAQTGSTYPYADIAAFHGYGTVSNANPEQIISQVQSLNQVLAAHGLDDLPLWNTEASWGALAAVNQDQAAWLMRYETAQAAAGVSRFLWYAYDSCGWGTLWVGPWCTGTTMPLGQLDPAGAAYPVIQNWLSGATLDQCEVYQNGLWICALERAGGYKAWMLWSSTGTLIDVPIQASSGLQFYRDWQNEVNVLGSDLMVGNMPVLLGNLNP